MSDEERGILDRCAKLGIEIVHASAHAPREYYYARAPAGVLSEHSGNWPTAVEAARAALDQVRRRRP